MKSDHRRPPSVTLEDLLRLKRAERPAPEFWARFDRELRVKQLAAIVEPRPWWAPFIRYGAVFSRYQLPVGATAALAITLLTLQSHRNGEIVQLDVRGIAEPTASVVLTASNPDEVKSVIAASTQSETLAQPSTRLAAPVEIESVAPSAGIARFVAPTPVAVREPSPSDRAVAANLAAAGFGEPQIGRMLAHLARATAPKAPLVEPLTQLSRPGDARRNRLAAISAAYSYSAAGDTPVRSADRMASRLTDERLSYTGPRRVDLGGDRVLVKFW